MITKHGAFWVPFLIFPGAVYAWMAVCADPFPVYFAVGGFFFIGVPVILAGVNLFIRGNRDRAFGMVLWAIGAAVVLIPANWFCQECAVESAKAYPDRVAPMLEQYRQEHGSYPASLNMLPGKPAVPRLLRESYGYGSRRDSYSFSFSPPGGVIDVWDYDSKTHSWHLST